MRLIILATVMAMGSLAAAAQQKPVGGAIRIPVKEVSIFKDGHAFVRHQGSVPVDPAGDLTLDFLPTPVLGTFWAYSPDKNVRILSTVAGQHRVVVDRPALKLAELLEANVGAEVNITEKPTGSGKDGLSYRATIMAVPHRSAADPNPAEFPPEYAVAAPSRGDLILLKTSDGVKAMPLDRIQDVTFRSEMQRNYGDDELRNLLTLRVEWNDKKTAKDAEVGLVYLQKGLRWIPNYRIVIDGKGAANVKLQGTLINELADLEDVAANLVVGVPSFAFKDLLDPLAMRQNLTLSSYFQTNERSVMSNAIMSQAASRAPATAPAVDLGPAVEGSQNEDLFLFPVKHLTLKKGQRLTLPISDNSLRYKDVYALNLPFGPPIEIQNAYRGGYPQADQDDAARLTDVRVMHRIRLANTSSTPITTAPALILENDTVLAQGMTTYGATGANVDLDLTKVVDIHVSRNEVETGRTANAMRLDNGVAYARVDLAGTLKLTSFRKDTVEIEVTREVLGEALTANANGQVQKVNVLESDRPSWWRMYNWPAWWNQMNGVGRITWRVTLPPGGSVDLSYTSRYFWR